MGEVERLRVEINRLDELATAAYNRQDFTEEDKWDEKAKPLRQRLKELTEKKCLKCGEYYSPERIDEKGFCYADSDKSVHPSHSYDPRITDPNQRCGNCGVKHYHGHAHFKCKGRPSVLDLLRKDHVSIQEVEAEYERLRVVLGKAKQ